MIVYPDRNSDFYRNLANYDRGWDGGPPVDNKIRKVIEKIIQQFDGKQVDWNFETYRR